MTKDTVFQQILKPLTKNLINECVKRFNTDYDYETFKTKDHLQLMIFAHLNEVKSLRTLEIAANTKKIGLSKKIKRSTVSDANKKRPAEAFFYILTHLS